MLNVKCSVYAQLNFCSFICFIRQYKVRFYLIHSISCTPSTYDKNTLTLTLIHTHNKAKWLKRIYCAADYPAVCFIPPFANAQLTRNYQVYDKCISVLTSSYFVLFFCYVLNAFNRFLLLSSHRGVGFESMMLMTMTMVQAYWRQTWHAAHTRQMKCTYHYGAIEQYFVIKADDSCFFLCSSSSSSLQRITYIEMFSECVRCKDTITSAQKITSISILY